MKNSLLSSLSISMVLFLSTVLTISHADNSANLSKQKSQEQIDSCKRGCTDQYSEEIRAYDICVKNCKKNGECTPNDCKLEFAKPLKEYGTCTRDCLTKSVQ